MAKIEFEFPEANDEPIEVESSLGSEEITEIADKPKSVKEPVEKPVVENDELEVEVVDDTPKADRNRTPSEPPEEVTEDELHEYSDKVQKRIKHFSKGYHDERRAKEAALREKQELERLTKQMLDENKKLKQTVGQSQSAMMNQAKVAIERDVNAAKEHYKKAYESGNADKLLEAQEALTTARLRSQQLESIESRALQSKESRVKQNQQSNEIPVAAPAAAPERDERATKWAAKNTWFGATGKDQMTSLALGYHTELVNNGTDPTSDEYYEKLDSRMRQVFPDEFEDTQDEPAGGSRRSSNVVAPATRSVSPRKVKLTQTQVNLAKRLGVPLEEYARQVAEIERNK